MANRGIASSKQLRLRQSLCNTDRLNATMEAVFGGEFGEAEMTDYLGRSARLMSAWVRDSPHFDVLRDKVTCWDPYIALVPTDTGPRYKLKADLAGGYERCGNVYFAQSFADLLLSLTLPP